MGILGGSESASRPMFKVTKDDRKSPYDNSSTETKDQVEGGEVESRRNVEEGKEGALVQQWDSPVQQSIAREQAKKRRKQFESKRRNRKEKRRGRSKSRDPSKRGRSKSRDPSKRDRSGARTPSQERHQKSMLGEMGALFQAAAAEKRQKMKKEYNQRIRAAGLKKKPKKKQHVPMTRDEYKSSVKKAES